jgi:hypothetical protein
MENNKISPDDIANKEELCLEGYLECPIDNMVSLNPLMCKKCETVFCPNCIEDWKKRSNVCPMRCNPIELIKTDKSIIRQQLNKVKVHCPFMKNGCPDKIMVNELARHERICEYRNVECDKCKEKIANINMISHVFESCALRRIQCPQCEISFNLKDLMGHFSLCNFNTCNFCSDTKTLSHTCNYELRECLKCGLPELSGSLNTIHKCVDKDNAALVSGYLKNLYTKIENNISCRINNRDNRYKEFVGKINEIAGDVIKKQNEKEGGFETKINEAKDKCFKRINVAKKERYDDIDKLKNELKDSERFIQGKYSLIF